MEKIGTILVIDDGTTNLALPDSRLKRMNLKAKIDSQLIREFVIS